MLYLPFNFYSYKNYSIYGDKIIFFKDSLNYINNTDLNNTKYDYLLYFINTSEYLEFNDSYLPTDFISFSHLDHISFLPVYENEILSYYTTDGENNPSYSYIYLNNDFSQFTNNIYFSSKFPQTFICGFINLLIIIFIINGLSRLIFKGGILFHK